MRGHSTVISIWLSLLFLVACRPSVSFNEPPAITYGQDICDECSMIITEERYAASYVTETGVVRRFDDIGGMLAYDHRMGEDVHIYWVHDFESNTWLDAYSASFVLNRDLVTPMGWGVAAFADKVRAETHVSQHGGVIATLSDLREKIASGSLDPEAFADHHQEHDGVAGSD